MKVVSDKKEMIFRNEIKYKDENGVEQSKTLYKISLSHRNADGSYSQTSILCKFPKDTDLKTKTLSIKLIEIGLIIEAEPRIIKILKIFRMWR